MTRAQSNVWPPNHRVILRLTDIMASLGGDCSMLVISWLICDHCMRQPQQTNCTIRFIFVVHYISSRVLRLDKMRIYTLSCKHYTLNDQRGIWESTRLLVTHYAYFTTDRQRRFSCLFCFALRLLNKKVSLPCETNIFKTFKILLTKVEIIMTF